MRAPIAAALIVLSSGCSHGGEDPDDFDNEFHVAGRVDVSNYVLRPEGEIMLAAVRVDVRTDGAPMLGNTWRQVHLDEDGEFDLQLPRRPAFSEMYRPDGEGGSFRIASYMLGAYVDSNQSGGPDKDDLLVAASTELIIFADGEHMHGTEGLSLPVGWNAVEWHIDGEENEVHEMGWMGHMEDTRIPANLLPFTRDAGLMGQVTSPMGAVNIDIYAVEGDGPNASISSVAVDASGAGATFRFPGPIPAPAADLLYVNDDIPGGKVAVAVALAYDDLDGDARYTPGVDARRGTSLDAGADARVLVYVKPMDFTAAFYEQVYGLASGWMLADARGEEDPKVDWKLGIVVGQGN